VTKSLFAEREVLTEAKDEEANLFSAIARERSFTLK
jgi:hypothetical protein